MSLSVRPVLSDRRSGRVLMSVVALLVMASCGWHPVYAPARDSSVPATLGRIDVAIIPERQGQLLRQALQARLQTDATGSTPDYVLQTGYSIASEGIAITPESSVTRLRLIATATFVLQALQTPPRTCTSGTARAVDGLDVQNQQFFASDLETETAERRLANAVADQIVTKLALALRSRGGAGCEAR